MTNPATVPLEQKAITAIAEELERQAAENPDRLKVRRTETGLDVQGEIDVDALVMVVIGSVAGGP
jgi:hypothetical protein